MCLDGLSAITPSLNIIMSENRQEMVYYARDLCSFLVPNFTVPQVSIECGKIVGVNAASFGTLQALGSYAQALQCV